MKTDAETFRLENEEMPEPERKPERAGVPALPSKTPVPRRAMSADEALVVRSVMFTSLARPGWNEVENVYLASSSAEKPSAASKYVRSFSSWDELEPEGLKFVPSPEAPGLRLWLPGYHTPSLNRTAGKHWAKVRRLKKQAAGALYEALRGHGLDNPSPWPGRAILGEARRVLSKILLGVPMEPKRGKKPAKPAVPAWLRIERVCCVLLDEENFKGGTKGLTDLLRYAFPTVLLDDAPGYVVMEHVQTRCAKRCEEGTWVELAGS